MRASFSTLFKSILVAMVLTIPSLGWSNTVEETPSATAMTADAIFVRPVMLVTTVLGAGIFIVSSPFSLLGNNVDEAFDTLVKSPFETTFVRCLGCTKNGRKVSKVVVQEEG